MCGIVYMHDLQGNPVNIPLMQQFDKQRNRGLQGFGLFDGQFMHLVKSVTEDKMLKWLDRYNSNLIMFHHRFPTSTKNVKRAAHPMSTRNFFGDNQYVMVHNGVIKNAKALHDKHVDMGIAYDTMLVDGKFNDSEALLWDFALTLEGKQPALTAEGDMAVVLMKVVDGALDTLYFGRNAWRPLKLHRDDERIELSSEGRGEAITAHQLYSYDYASKELSQQAFTFPTGYRAPAYTPGYTPQEYPSQRNNYNNYGPASTTFGKPIEPTSRYGYEDYDDEIEYNNWLARSSRSYANRMADKFGSWLEGRAITVVRQDDVDRTVREFLTGCANNFQAAYWAIQLEMEELMEAMETDMSVSLQREYDTLEQAMSQLEDDPEWEDDDSVSSVGGTPWTSQNQKLLTA